MPIHVIIQAVNHVFDEAYRHFPSTSNKPTNSSPRSNIYCAYHVYVDLYASNLSILVIECGLKPLFKRVLCLYHFLSLYLNRMLYSSVGLVRMLGHGWYRGTTYNCKVTLTNHCNKIVQTLSITCR